MINYCPLQTYCPAFWEEDENCIDRGNGCGLARFLRNPENKKLIDRIRSNKPTQTQFQMPCHDYSEIGTPCKLYGKGLP